MTHAWSFRRTLRARAFGPRAGARARQRIREATAEVRAVAAGNPAVAAEGAVQLLERLAPALEELMYPTAALHRALDGAVAELVAIAAAPGVDAATRRSWLDRVFESAQGELEGYLRELAARWGELCGSAAAAAAWADDLLPAVLQAQHRGPLACCLSALVAAGRHAEVVALVEGHPHGEWLLSRHVVTALRALGRAEEALAVARAAWERGHHTDAVCEALLLELGRPAEALRDHAVAAHRRGTARATFRAIRATYPDAEPEAIVAAMLAAEPDGKGTWLAFALETVDPRFLAEQVKRRPLSVVGVRDRLAEIALRDPVAAGNLGLFTLGWIARGHGDGRPSTARDLLEGALHAAARARRLRAALRLLRELIDNDDPRAAWLRDVLADRVAAWEERLPARAAEPIVTAPPASEAERVLVAFATPFLDEVAAEPNERALRVVEIALTAWNCAVFEAWGSPAPHAETAVGRLASEPSEQRLLERVLAAKRRDFGHHQWAVGPGVLTRAGDGSWRLETEVFGRADVAEADRR